jgi:hypothetical protein
MSNPPYITCHDCGRARLGTMLKCRCGSVLVKQYAVKPDHPQTQTAKPRKPKSVQPSPARAEKNNTGSGEFFTSTMHRNSDSQESEA